jgi:hypothetical protein
LRLQDPDDGTTDLDGNPRTIGPNPDIGAYEAVEAAPTIAAGTVSGLATTGATINATVDPGFSATTVQAFVGTTTANEVPGAMQSAGVGTSPVNVSLPLSALTPGTLYHYRVVASNALGTVATTDQTFTTIPVLSSTTAIVALKLAGLKSGTQTVTVKLAYHETVKKHGRRRTVTVTETVRASFRVC